MWALDFLDPILTSDLLSVLGPTPRHAAVLRTTIHEFGRPFVNIFHDLQIAVTMSEHGVPEIMTADADFQKFSLPTVTNPLRPGR